MIDNNNKTIKNENFFKKVFTDKLFIIFSSVNAVLNLLIWLVIYWQIKPNTESVFLHYNIYFGIDAIGSYAQLYYLSLSGLIIFLLNLIISFIIYKRGQIICYLLLISSIIAQIIIFVATILIVLLNK